MLEKKVELYIDAHSMHDIYNGAILGFSGGSDSSALLYFLKDRVKNLLCVHINHMIRADEADRDENAARALCEEYGVKFVSYKIDIPALAREQRLGLEECARNERYRVFNELLSKNSEYKCIVTAHNLDDNAETVIFNLARGTGLKGLSGISPVSGKIMRPLLNISKREIIEYCLANNIRYVEDSTNKDTAYTRNHIRHNILPQLEKINPEYKDAISRLGEIIESDEAYFERTVDKIIEENGISDKINLNLLNSLDISVASRLIKRLLGKDADYLSIESCLKLAKKANVGSLINLKNGLSFKIERDYASFVSTRELDKTEFYLPLDKDVNYLDALDMVISVNLEICDTDLELLYEVKLNKEKINAPLYVRSRREGDTIKSGKMTKKLKKLFVDKHIPSHLRHKIPLILMDGEIISVPNVATRDNFSGNDYIINIYRRRK